MRTLGLRVKSGFVVAVAIESERRSWRLVHCSQVPLTASTGQYARFPYHPLIELDSKAGPVVSREAISIVRSESARRLDGALRSLGTVAGAGIVAGSSIDPETITNPHIRVHAMEGQLFREVVIAALERARIPHLIVRDQECLTELAAALGISGDGLRDTISQRGREFTKPWRADEKLAAAGAIYALHVCAGHP